MKLETELKKLKELYGTEKALEQIEILRSHFTTKEDKEKISVFVKRMAQEDIKKQGKDIEEFSLKVKLAEVSDIISLNFIAKTYFKKSRSWLHQRINGNIVNNKMAAFTDEEKKTLNFALKDIAKKIGTISI